MNRPGIRPSATPAPAAAAQTSEKGSAAFEVLKTRHQDLMMRRSRFELLSEQAEAEVRACEAEAAKLGISSLEALEARIQELQAQEARELEAFEQALAAEEQLQRQAQERLDAVEG